MGRLAIWLTVLFLTGLLFAWRVGSNFHIDSDLLSLLPETERDPVAAAGLKRVADGWSKKVVFLLGHEDEDRAFAAAEALASALDENPLFTQIQGRIPDDREKDFFDFYFKYRYRLPQPLDGVADSDRLLQNAERKLYSPMTSFYAELLEDDPLFLFSSALERIPKPSANLQSYGGYLTIKDDNRLYVLLTADTVGAAFNLDRERDPARVIESILANLQDQNPELDIAAVGLVRYASKAAQQAQGEVALISTISLAGVLILFLLAFRSIRPMVWGLLPILAGIVTAFAVTHLIFGRIHMVTLGFGAGLIGVCVDYNFHFFCERYKHVDGQAALAHIFPAISLGALTTLIGYLGLLPAPFPGLRQMAVFSATGVSAAFATVCLVFPLSRGSYRPPFLIGLGSKLCRRLTVLAKPKIAALVLLGPLVLILSGLPSLRHDDDIRRLQNPDPLLKQEEEKVTSLIGNVESNRFFLIEGESPEAVLQKEESLRRHLDRLKSAGELGFYQGISQFVPSQARQEAYRKQFQTMLLDTGKLEGYFQRMGFEAALLERQAATLRHEVSPKLTPETWLTHPVSSSFRYLWLGETQRGYASLVLLGGIKNLGPLAELETPEKGIHYIDQVGDISVLLTRYRHSAQKLVAGAYLFIFIILVIRYGLKRGIRVFLPPLLAMALGPAIFGLFGQPLNLFHYLSLLLVLGIGIDYTIFFAESPKAETLTAVCLSFLTTLLSFGVLALSSSPVLQAFGQMISLGLLPALILAPLAGNWRKS